ncbi:MAG: AI-2E family transporter [Lachnospiraceae bacterium]|nr:AI-2E family transporter [Lachnospiraceae bacterium]
MKFRIDKKYLAWGLTAFCVAAASMLFYYLLFHMGNIKSAFGAAVKICMPIIDGLVIAYLLSPVVNYLEHHVFFPLCKKTNIRLSIKNKRRIRLGTSLITLCLMLLLVYWFCVMIIPQLIESIQNIILQLPTYINNLSSWLEGIFEQNKELSVFVNNIIVQYSGQIEEVTTNKLIPQLNEIVQSISSTVFSSVLNVLLMAWNFFIGLIIALYLLLSKELFAGQGKKIIYALFEESSANAAIKNIRFVNSTFGGFISGKIVDSLIIGMLCFIGMTLLNLPYPLLISVIIGVTNIIPFFGPFIGAIPSTILILMVNPLQALYFLIFVFVLQQFDGNILGPKILGDKTGLSSFWVIFAITLFGGYWGFLGMAIGVPVFAVLYAAWKAFINRSLNKKGLSTDTQEYLNLSEIKNNEYIELPPPKVNGFKKSKKEKTKDVEE